VRHLAPVFLVGMAFAPGCTCKHPAPATGPGAGSSAGADPVPPPAPGRPVVLDVIGDLDACALGHRGVLIDFGDPSTRDAVHPGSIARGDDEPVEHEGATWLRVRSRTVTASFYWPPVVAGGAPEESAYVEARVRGITAHAVAVAIDGKPVGTWKIGKNRDDTRIVLARAVGNPITLAPGGHELTMRFIDWAHVGTGDPGDPYAAPTRQNVLLESTVAGRSLRALSLRAPGFVRCSGWIPADATLEVWLAAAGGGDADVDARLLRDRKPPVVLGSAHVTGGGDGGWAPWSVPVTGLDGHGALASIELVARRAGKGTRVLLGEPRVVAAAAATGGAAQPAAARGVVLVVLGSTAARSLAPWGGPHAVPELARLASQGTLFAAHRAVSSLASADVASMLTGLPPRAHGVDDRSTRLPRAATTVEEACREGGVSTAMFTADPTTGAAFGFDRGWDTFVAHDPLEHVPATQVFDDAAAWIDAHKGERFFVVVDARGGHPPWDASPAQLETMPPDGYVGMVEPARAAEVLAKAARHPGRFKEDDRVRAWALYDHAVDAHDAALGRLLAGLRAAGRDDDTAVVVTSDVATSEAQPVPFVDVDALDEPLLATPLVVRWPHAAALAGRRVTAPSSPVDLGRTVLAIFGLTPPPTFQGTDLARLAGGALVPAERPLAATRGTRFAARWGPFVLIGTGGRETRMCDLSLDPTCVADVRATSPLALEPLHRWAADHLAPDAVRPLPREAATLDEHTNAALVRWGHIDDDREGDESP
jgi:arylsulfatase A-like enzyme